MRKGRVLAIMMAVLMVVTLLPSMVFASAAPSGALDGTLKIKGNAAVGITLSADYSKVKPEGITDDLVDFSWSLKDGDLLTEVSTDKTYKIDETALGLPIVLKITGKSDKGISGELTAETYEVSATEEEAKALAEQKKAEEKTVGKTEDADAASDVASESSETVENENTEISEEGNESEAQTGDTEENSTPGTDSEASDENSDTDAATGDNAVVEVNGNSENNENAEAAQEETAESTAETNSSEKNTDAVQVDGNSDQQGNENKTEELTYSAEVTTDDGSGVLNFGTVEEGYTEIPEAQYVSITNTGTGDLNFKSISPKNFMVQDINDQPLKSGETVTAWAKPREELPVGEYKDPITYETEEGVQVSFEADFTVKAAEKKSEEKKDSSSESDDNGNQKGKFKLSVDNPDLSFETLTEGYEETETLTVTIKNDGTETVTLVQPDSDYFDITPVTSVETEGNIQIAAEDEQMFTVQPKAGLPAKEEPYADELKFSAEEDENTVVTVNAQITVKAAAEEKVSVSTDPSEKDFGSLEQGYDAAPDAVTITVTNTGNVAVRLAQPEANSYVVGKLSAEVVNPGESATFTIQPKLELPAGDYSGKIYIKDLDGTELDSVEVFFGVTEPEPVYDLSISPDSVEFGTSAEGYKNAPDAQTVTVTNTGNTNITLQQPESKYYTVGSFSTTELAAGASATFSVQPKSGLTKGEYLEDITVENSANVELYVNAHFSVTKKNDDNNDTAENLTGIKKPSDIKDLPNGTEKSQKALKLPSTVKITTTKGEKEASVKWDVKGCSYNPSSSDRQTFNVKGTVTLPDGVKNPDKISTVIAVSVTVNGYTGSKAKESDNKITGIDANGKYDTNSKITFTAVGAGMNNESPKKGDTRFLPASWKITETRTWDAAPYTATFRVSKPGQYTLKVTFAEQKYDGSKWSDIGSSTESQVTFTVSQAAALTATPSPAVTGANKKSAVQTGDSTPIMTFVIILVIAAVCIGGVLVYRKKKK